ncbi:metal-dependent transcriptional regulator [Corynebacterium atypicum]|uniref:metal-dependent transcriptional regulator n=1 Tax=Corynebacterium atypicum TaxID=191610 RepID=UPI00068B345B|nr:metal-dependent transcriptional regulator [Corynebacterium atypicum]
MTDLKVTDLPPRSQDYLKKIFDLVDWEEGDVSTRSGVALSELADALGQQRSTASEAVKRLAGLGLVDHTPYRPIMLTERGREFAIELVRRHRLVETFLAEVVGYRVEEIHAEAEVLEHAVSDLFIERIDKALGYPTRDPHGDPIPDADGNVTPVDCVPLSQVPEGEYAEVVRLRDRDSSLLRYLTDSGLAPGVRVRLLPAPYAGVAHIEVCSPGRAAEQGESEGGGAEPETGRDPVTVDADALSHIQVRLGPAETE